MDKGACVRSGVDEHMPEKDVLLIIKAKDRRQIQTLYLFANVVLQRGVKCAFIGVIGFKQRRLNKGQGLCHNDRGQICLWINPKMRVAHTCPALRASMTLAVLIRVGAHKGKTVSRILRQNNIRGQRRCDTYHSFKPFALHLIRCHSRNARFADNPVTF